MPVVQGVSESEAALLDHGDKGHLLLSVHWALKAVAAAFLAVRLYCKVSYKRGLWWDDWILIGTWVRFTYIPLCHCHLSVLRNFSILGLQPITNHPQR